MGTFCLSILLPSPIKPLLCNMPTVDGEKRNQNEIIVSVKSSTVSKERLPMLDCDEYIQKPGIGRAEQVGDYSVLQQHIIFWDRNGDGVITPIDTYIGFRELGFNIFFSLIAVVVINLNFSLPTRLAHSWIPDPLFREKGGQKGEGKKTKKRKEGGRGEKKKGEKRK